MRHKILLIVIAVLSPLSVQAGWSDVLEFFSSSESTSENGSATGLSNAEIITGLKQALIKGSSIAVNTLGKKNGFFKHPQLKIPMPDKLQTAESALRKVGQDEIADEFVLSLNRAAEQAVPVAGEILTDIVGKMSIQDGYDILRGPDDAATRYLQEKGGQTLKQRFLPIVEQATEKVGVTRHYKSLLDNLGVMSSLVDTGSLDIDNYVADEAIDGLFQLIARQEKLIRQDPVARTTDILKKVFSAQ